MPEVSLDGPCVLPLAGEVEPASVPELVRVNAPGEPCKLTRPGDDPPNAGGRERPLPLRDEQTRRAVVVSAELAQYPKLRTAEGVDTWRSVFDPGDVQRPGVEVHRIPPKRYQLGHAETAS